MPENSYTLFEACKKGTIDGFESLCSKVDVNLKDINGSAPICLAAAQGFTRIVEILINHGANLDSQNDFCNTPLHLAVRFNFKDTAELLITKGANTEIENRLYLTPLMASSNADMTNFLLDHGVNINYQNKRGRTALHKAVYGNINDIAELLINSGADVNIKTDVTPYEQAVRNKNTKLMVLLKPEIINEQDFNGRTLLMNACDSKNEELVFFLVERAPPGGDDFFLENSSGESAFKILKRKRNLPDQLQSLKEKLTLDRDIEAENNLSVGL